jgi:phosphatidate cytidylyltransferase
MLMVAVVLAGFCAVLFSPAAVDGADRRMAWLVAGPFYIGGLLGVIVRMHQTEANGGGWVLVSMFFAFFSDTGAYFAGRFLGNKKLYEKVSPRRRPWPAPTAASPGRRVGRGARPLHVPAGASPWRRD